MKSRWVCKVRPAVFEREKASTCVDCEGSTGFVIGEWTWSSPPHGTGPCISPTPDQPMHLPHTVPAHASPPHRTCPCISPTPDSPTHLAHTGLASCPLSFCIVVKSSQHQQLPVGTALEPSSYSEVFDSRFLLEISI